MRQSKHQNQNQKLELSDKEFKITMTNMLKVLMEKVQHAKTGG